MKNLIALAMTVCGTLLPITAAGQGPASLSQAEVARINEATQSFVRAVLARDVKTLAAFYADDAVLYPPGETAVKGRASIEACLSGLPSMKNFTLRNPKVEGRDDLAYVQGTYIMTLEEAGLSGLLEESGYYLEIRRRQPDGRWLIAVHMLTPHQ